MKHRIRIDKDTRIATRDLLLRAGFNENIKIAGLLDDPRYDGNLYHLTLPQVRRVCKMCAKHLPYGNRLRSWWIKKFDDIVSKHDKIGTTTDAGEVPGMFEIESTEGAGNTIHGVDRNEG